MALASRVPRTCPKACWPPMAGGLRLAISLNPSLTNVDHSNVEVRTRIRASPAFEVPRIPSDGSKSIVRAPSNSPSSSHDGDSGKEGCAHQAGRRSAGKGLGVGLVVVMVGGDVVHPRRCFESEEGHYRCADVIDSVRDALASDPTMMSRHHHTHSHTHKTGSLTHIITPNTHTPQWAHTDFR